MINAIKADCQGRNGVIHQSKAPINTAEATPPTKPSIVLFGLIFGAIG